MHEHTQKLADRAQAERERHGSVDAVFEMVDRDLDVGGGIIAGALAYRLFIWLLPLALVLVAGLGIAADSADRSPESVAESAGLDSLVSASIASAAKSSNRWYALLVGIPALIYVTRGLLRALIAAHRLVWLDVRASVPRPTLLATFRLLALLLGAFTLGGLTSAIREWSAGVGLTSMVLVGILYAGLWLLVTLYLPHGSASVSALVPGALLFGLGVEGFQLFTAYVLGPWAISKQGTYGALGIAAALLLGLFLLCRLIVAAAIVNATVWERRGRRTPDGNLHPGG